MANSESDAVKATATVPAGDVKDVGTPSSAAASSKAASPEKEPEKDAGTEEEPSAAAPGASSKPVVDMEVFEQLLEIDDDETHEFSKTLAWDYIAQAETTFEGIEEALEKSDLTALSRLGHFLKGSSAALGLQRVQRTCECMQHYGNLKEADGHGSIDSDEALKLCKALLVSLKAEQKEAKAWLEEFYATKD